MAHYKKDAPPVAVLVKDLGRKIEMFRLSQNLRQEDIAEATGLSRSTVVRLESGKGGTIDSLVRILKALGIEGRIDALVPDARISPMDRRDDPHLRQRARPSEPEAKTGSWKWGDE